MTKSLFQPMTLGRLTLKNRIVMPPMTRSRASQPGDVANDLMATYYAQRASAGLIVSEGTQISSMAKGYAWTPGIYTPEHIAGWKKVTDAVHAEGGAIFAQLWHVGRVTHPDNIGGEQLFLHRRSRQKTSRYLSTTVPMHRVLSMWLSRAR